MSWTLDPAREQTILLPFDFSTPARRALESARSLVARPQLLWVLYVIPPLEATSPGVVLGQTEPKELRRRADEALAEALAEAGLSGCHRRVTLGDPAAEILDAAGELDVEMIVIPSRGKTGLRRWMIGSVAERVVRRARCPVLVLPISPEHAAAD